MMISKGGTRKIRLRRVMSLEKKNGREFLSFFFFGHVSQPAGS